MVKACPSADKSRSGMKRLCPGGAGEKNYVKAVHLNIYR
jgi:hypothetical protein